MIALFRGVESMNFHLLGITITQQIINDDKNNNGADATAT